MDGRFAAGRPVHRGTAGAGLFAVTSRSLACALAFAGFALAQQPGGNPPAADPPAARPPAVDPPVAGAVQAPAAAVSYGKVLVDGAKLRCWPSAVAAPPVFEDTLAKDQVVVVGRSESGFRAVVLPLGPVGYVNKKFAVADDAGHVVTKGTKVAFRYRPKSTEAPVALLADGTALAVAGEVEDWWRARVAAVEAWLPEAELQVLESPDAAAVAAAAELHGRLAAEVQARLDAIAAQRQREARNRADEAAVKVVEDAFAAELRKPTTEQQYQPLEQALDRLDGSFAADSSGKAQIAVLRQRIQAQKWIVEASAVRDSKPVPSAAPTTPPQPKDELERFTSIGWLRYESRLAGVGTYYLEKGGVRQHLVSCSSGRYDLALFIGREIGVNGPRRRPATESLSILDVERLEVLGGMRR
ncbi:MAG: hypothetical protein FJ265_02850 [Planctomycetes bacterium]|nr:hypothetical protein [Planctomycetota bacterium]